MTGFWRFKIRIYISLHLDKVSCVCDNVIMKELLIYDLKNGKEPFIEWLKSIKDPIVRARIKSAILKLSHDHFGDYKKINKDISEIRLHFGSGYRIYFSELDKIIILLLCGGDKSTQSKDIEKAIIYLKDYKERKYDKKL